jgi:hypothetical protein
MECFNSRDERLTYEQLTARIKDARRLSKARTADRIQGLIQTGMVVQHVQSLAQFRVIPG